MNSWRCFKVQCRCTNSSNDAVCRDELEGKYLDCENSTLYVVAPDFVSIKNILPINIISITDIGPGYHT